MMNFRNKYALLVCFCAILLSAKNIYAAPQTQIFSGEEKPFSSFYLGIGLAGDNIFDSNPALDPINSQYVIGGSFDGVESGIALQLETNLDSKSKFMMPIRFENIWMDANEQYVRASYRKEYWKHKINCQKFSAGVDWFFYTFPFRDCKAYLGAEAKVFFVNGEKFTVKEVDRVNEVDTSYTRTFKVKESAVRLGGEVKLGFRGHLSGNFYLNCFAGIQAHNLLLRDDERGELLTPISTYEDEESIVWGLHYNFSVEYKLR